MPDMEWAVVVDGRPVPCTDAIHAEEVAEGYTRRGVPVYVAFQGRVWLPGGVRSRVIHSTAREADSLIVVRVKAAAA